MNKFLSKILVIALLITAICSFALFIGCNQGDNNYTDDYAGAGDITQPYFQTNKVELSVNEKYALVFSETNGVVWSSANESIATISQTGEITAVGEGSTFVKATVDGKDYNCLVIVSNDASFISLSLDKTSVSNLLVGVKTTIKTNLSYNGIENLVLEWSSSNEDVVDITASSNDGCEIQAKSKGSAIINVKYQNRVSAVCSVSVVSNEPSVFEGNVNRPNGFENVNISLTAFDDVTTDESVSVSNTQDLVEFVDDAIYDDVDNDGIKEIVVFGALKGFSDYTINSTFANRFAYGVLLNVFETDSEHANYYLKNQKIYSTVEADANGNFAVVIDNVPEGVYAVQTFVEYVEDGKIIICESQGRKVFGEDEIVSAIKSSNDYIARLYDGWNADVYNFGDAGGFTDAYLKTNIPTDKLDDKTPIVSYDWDVSRYIAFRVGLQNTIDKKGIINYNKFIGVDKLYVELFISHPSTYERSMNVLTDVNTDGSGVYETVKIRTNEWVSVKFDLEMIVENYDVIFNTANDAEGGLVLIATPKIVKGSNEDYSSADNGNVFYVGEAYLASEEYINELEEQKRQEKYGNVDHVNAIKTSDNLVARIYYGHSANVYNFGDAGGYTEAYLKSSVPTEQVDGKTPIISYYWEKNDYYSLRLGVYGVISKVDLENYKKYSNIDTLYFEFYMSHIYTYERSMKVLIGVNTDGTGIYEMVKLGTNKWLTLSYDVNMLIENYNIIFNASNASDGGLVLIATPNKNENNFDWNALDYNNKFYVGDIFYASKESKDKEKYSNATKVSAISSSANIIATGWTGNSGTVYTSFSDEGGAYSAFAVPNLNPTEAVGGKVPTIKVGIKTDKYLATRFGLQPSLTKADLVGYKKYSGLTKLYVEFYNEHALYPTAMKRVKVLTGVNEDGSGVYEFVEYESGKWHTIEFDLQMLIDNYDTIFAPTYKFDNAHEGLCLICSANSAKEGADVNMVSMNNTMYLGEIYLGK